MLYLQKCQWNFLDGYSNSHKISTAFTLFETIWIPWIRNANFFKIQDGSDRGPNSIDVIWHKKSAEDAYLTKAIDGRIRIQLLLQFRTVTIANAYPSRQRHKRIDE